MNVPKKVNRHVLKAMHILSNGNANKTIPLMAVINQVEYQMRNLVPVPHLETVIEHALMNLSEVGLIQKKGSTNFTMGHSYGMASRTTPGRPIPQLHREYFQPRVARKRSVRNLDPNSHVDRHYSQESVSGDEYDRARKRLRTNTRKFQFHGGNVPLPKSKNHASQQYDVMAPEWSDIGYLSDGAIDDYSLKMFSQWANAKRLYGLPTNWPWNPAVVSAALQISEIPNVEPSTSNGQSSTKETSEMKLMKEQNEIYQEAAAEENVEEKQKQMPSTLPKGNENTKETGSGQNITPKADKKSQETITKSSLIEVNSKMSSKANSKANMGRGEEEEKKQHPLNESLSHVEDMEIILSPRSMSYLN
uniref:Uncharacterized protein n=1 Tax=Musca domestica TaxID=7370 RepID=A0A1I8NE34_MUSDO